MLEHIARRQRPNILVVRFIFMCSEHEVSLFGVRLLKNVDIIFHTLCHKAPRNVGSYSTNVDGYNSTPPSFHFKKLRSKGTKRSDLQMFVISREISPGAVVDRIPCFSFHFPS